MFHRRELLKGVSLGAGSLVFSPLLRTFAAQAEGNYTPPKRVVFVLFDRDELIRCNSQVAADDLGDHDGLGGQRDIGGDRPGGVSTGNVEAHPVTHPKTGSARSLAERD